MSSALNTGFRCMAIKTAVPCHRYRSCPTGLSLTDSKLTAAFYVIGALRQQVCQQQRHAGCQLLRNLPILMVAKIYRMRLLVCSHSLTNNADIRRLPDSALAPCEEQRSAMILIVAKPVYGCIRLVSLSGTISAPWLLQIPLKPVNMGLQARI